MIYEITVVPTGPVYLYQRRHKSLANVNTSLLKACKQIYYEAEPFVYRNRQGILGDREHIELHLQHHSGYTENNTLERDGYIPNLNAVTISKLEKIIFLLEFTCFGDYLLYDVWAQTSILRELITCLQALDNAAGQKVLVRLVLREQ